MQNSTPKIDSISPPASSTARYAIARFFLSLPEVAYVSLLHTPPQASFSLGKPARVPDVTFLSGQNELQYPRSPEGTAGRENPRLTGNSSHLLLP